MKQKLQKRDIAQEITDLFVSFLEESKCLPYVKEWDPDLCQQVKPPHNPITGTVYSGANFWTLSLCKPAIQSDDYRYVTFLEAKQNGWHVKKDSKSFPVVYSAPLAARDAEGKPVEAGADRPSVRFMHRATASSMRAK